MMNPKTYKKLVVKQLSRDFRAAVDIVEADFPIPAPNEIVVRNLYAGVNASDVNIAAGVYFLNTVPFDVGVEAASVVVALGKDVQHLHIGDHVITFQIGGGYREYFAVDASQVIPIKEATREILTVVASGMTAAIGLEVVGEIKSSDVVLVTAAAGGTGSYAVQLALLAGAHVIGTCRSHFKVEFLKQLGCHRAIDYSQENLDEVLKKEYPQGIDLVYECVGSELFDICVDNLARRGRLVIAGYISEYLSPELELVNRPRIYNKLLWKSASLRGFLFTDYLEYLQEKQSRLMELVSTGKIKPAVDPTEFRGIESIVDAVEYLYSGQNCGKVIVRF
ncbi:MAG: zinc-binding dehydrogenase [Nostoc sp. ChiSLP01]|nr:zinc-binding dehydrogenase [Nostoc sp. CmiSLP01]MDZ8287339.1 zinc-binding dehydrogenase [Nostoc sp. ChiSLP01]